MPTIGFPLLLIPLALYNVIVFLMPDVAFTTPLVTLRLPSAASWTVTLGDVLVALGIILLLFEMVKAARPGAKYLTDHLLSLVVSGGAAAEFALLKPFATSTYFLLTLLAVIDFLGGASIALRWRKARRTAVVPAAAPAAAPHAEPPSTTPARVEPMIETPAKPAMPEPAPQAPPASAVPSQNNNAPAAESPKPTDKISNWNVADIVSGVETPSDKTPAAPSTTNPHPVDPPKPTDKP
jgi:hypothetical protein